MNRFIYPFATKTAMPIFLLLVLSLAPALLMAQRTQRFKAGLLAGLTASQIDGDQSAGYNKIGLQAGIRAIALLTQRSNATVEILFSQRGAQNELIPSGGNQFSLTLNYIEVPVMWHYNDWYSGDDEDEKNGYYKVSFDAGLSFARLIGYKVDDDLTNVRNVAAVLNKNDLSFAVGASFFTNRHLGFAVRYNRSIGFMYNPEKSPSLPSTRAWLGHCLYFQTIYVL